MSNIDTLINIVKPYTYCTHEVLSNIKRLASIVNRNMICGDFVECGTYKGGSAAIISTELTDRRHLWLYDSFKGMPDVLPIDGLEAKKHVGDCIGTIKEVRYIIASVGVNDDKYTIIPGWFEDTFKEPLPERVALLHCDADWYESVLTTLETFYPLIPDGGCIILDDFGSWEGCREAFYDFCEKYKLRPLLNRVGHSQAYWFKGVLHNRDKFYEF